MAESKVSILVDPEIADLLQKIAEAENLRPPRGPGKLAATVRFLARRWTPPEARPENPVRA